MNQILARPVHFAGKEPHLFVLIVVAFALRISGVFWGLPPFDDKIYHPDEPKIIVGAHNFPRDVAERTDLRYPTALHYTLGALVWPLKKLLEVSGYGLYSFPVVHMAGRLLSVGFGTATVLLLYFLANRIYDRSHALVASVACCFSMFHVTNSAWATTDVATSFWLTLLLFLLIHAIEKRSVFLNICTGAALGMLVGTKYTGAIAVVPLLVLVVAYQRSRHPDCLWRQGIAVCRDPVIWVVCISALVVFLITTPGIWLNPVAFYSSLEYERARMLQSSLPLWDIEVWRNLLIQVCRTMGWPLAISAFLGLWVSIAACYGAFEISIVLLTVVFVVAFGNALLARYLIMLLPVFALLSARFLLAFSPARCPYARFGGLLVAFCVLLHAGCYSVLAVVSRYPDTRSIAAQYIREHIPPGSTIGIAYTSARHGWKRHGWRYPSIDFNVLPYVDFLEGPQFVIVSSYDGDQIRQTLETGVLSSAFALPPSLAHQWYENSPPSPAIFNFFHELYYSEDSAYTLVRKFSPPHLFAPIEFPPPVIEIFRRRHL